MNANEKTNRKKTPSKLIKIKLIEIEILKNLNKVRGKKHISSS